MYTVLYAYMYLFFSLKYMSVFLDYMCYIFSKSLFEPQEMLCSNQVSILYKRMLLS